MPIPLKVFCFILGLFFSAKAVSDDNQSKPLMNVQINPLSLILLGLDGKFDFKFFGPFSMGVQSHYYDFQLFDLGIRSYGAGVNWRYFLNGAPMTTSWVATFASDYRFTETSQGNPKDPEPLEERYLTPKTHKKLSVDHKVLGGYQWIWPTGFNLALGAGTTYSHVIKQQTLETQADGEVHEVSSPDSKPTLTGEVTLGWAF